MRLLPQADVFATASTGGLDSGANTIDGTQAEFVRTPFADMRPLPHPKGDG